MSRLMRLYPAAWRDRYEAEFLRLLEERPTGIRGSVDVVLGAVDAQMHPELVGAERQPLTHRLPGLLALTAGAIWVAWFLNAWTVGPNGDWGESLGYAVVLMFLAVPGDYLAAYGRRIGITIAAVVLALVLGRALPWSVADGILNMVAGLTGWLLIGAAMLTLVGIRAGIGPRARWFLLAVAVLVPAIVGIPILAGFFPVDPGGATTLLAVVLPVPYGFAWMLFGLRMTIRGSATIHDTPSNPRASEVPAT